MCSVMHRIHFGTRFYSEKLLHTQIMHWKRQFWTRFGGKCHGRLVYSFLVPTQGYHQGNSFSPVVQLLGVDRSETECEKNVTECKLTLTAQTIVERKRKDICSASDICDNPLLLIQTGKHSSQIHCSRLSLGHVLQKSFTLGKIRMQMPGDNAQKRWYSAKQSGTRYYDVLGLTPKASSKEIKSAYYSLSKLYHPDLKTDDASEAKFSEISEAYEVLGNKRRKRIYDRGVLNPLDPRSGHAASDVGDDEDILRGRQYGQFKKRGPIQTGRSNIYDFDEFYKHHYGESMRRTHADKKAKEQQAQQQAEALKSVTIRSRLGVIAALSMIAWALTKMIK